VSLRRTLSGAVAALLAAAALGVGGTGAAHAATVTAPSVPGPAAAVRHHTPPDQCSAASYEGNALLGPADLPVTGRVGRQLAGYRRTGSLSVAAFLARYRDAAGTGWVYPPDNGFTRDRSGAPIIWIATLERGEQVDRYGSVYGAFLAPAGTGYAARAIPPSNLDSTPAGSCNYHDYTVVKAFRVDAGRIAPWFAQPGGGVQFMLDGALLDGSPSPVNVQWLLGHGYLRED